MYLVDCISARPIRIFTDLPISIFFTDTDLFRFVKLFISNEYFHYYLHAAAIQKLATVKI